MAARKTRRQLQFTGLEMTLIAASFVVTVTVVFFLGLFVGKKNASYHAPAEDRVARVPVDDFSRYRKPAASSDQASAAAPGAGGGAKAGVADSTLVASKSAAPADASKSAKKPEASSKPAAKPVAQESPAKKDAPKPEEARKEEPRKEEPKKEEPKKEEPKAEPVTGRGYTVQILATRREADADALVRKLKSRGYAAYIKKIGDGGGAWYRVRVGSFGAFSEARVMADKCRHDLGLGQAFVSTE